MTKQIGAPPAPSRSPTGGTSCRTCLPRWRRLATSTAISTAPIGTARRRERRRIEREPFHDHATGPLIVVLGEAAGHPVAPGELSLAGAELIDLLKTPTIRLDGGRIVPGHLPGPADPLLTRAAAALVMHSDWLWRRGHSLTDTYKTALEAQGLIVRESHAALPPRAQTVQWPDGGS